MNDSLRHLFNSKPRAPLINDQLYVITGGPGSGKTTVLHELQARGYRCVPEVARQIIQEQMESGGNAVPWGEA